MVSVRLDACENPGRLPCLPDAAQRLVNRGSNNRMPALSQVPHVDRQVIRPDEHPIDAVDSRNRFDVRERGSRLDLRDDADLRGDVTREAAPQSDLRPAFAERALFGGESLLLAPTSKTKTLPLPPGHGFRNTLT